MSPPAIPVEIIVVFHCKHRADVHFTPYFGVKYKHVVLHVEILNCTVDVTELDYVLDVGDARVFVTGLTLFRKVNDRRSLATLRGIRSVVAFSFDLKEETQDFNNIFDSNDSYPELVEIGITGVALATIPDTFKNMFPNLQSLEISNNKLVRPPDSFPWMDTTVMLPRNISRSLLMQNHYSNYDFVTIPSNIFRRYFTLDRNQIEDLSNFSFHGHLHKISLKQNGLKWIGNNTFRTASGLQNLDLSGNLITYLPIYVFKGLNLIRKLDLSGNRIELLSNGIFSDLSSLKILNLENNKLRHIDSGTFSNLYQLENIRLGTNLLEQIIPEAFPLDTINLREMHFQNNPIEKLPSFPFWIRGLKLVNFQSTSIAIDNFTQFLEDIDTLRVLHSVIDSASDADVSDLLKRPDTLTKIDLTNSSVSQLGLRTNVPAILNKTLLVLLLHFEFVLTDNPISCDCNINNISAFIKFYVENGTLSRNEYFYKDWVCAYPTELAGHKMLNVLPTETYCPIATEGCPSDCNCYKRSAMDNIIVDCRNKEIMHMHTVLPHGAKLELWYSMNNISKLFNIPNAENVTYLDVSFNKIEAISGELIKEMKSLEEFHIHSNVLAHLPSELASLRLTNATIWPNPLTCDCKSLWLKTWLVKNKGIVNRWNDVSCKIEKEDGMLIREVDDEKFVCRETEFDELRYVVMPAIVCSTVVVVLLIAAFVFYAYRLECKVLLFVYFGLHPFDNDSDDKKENLDCVIVHSGRDTDWVMEQIVALLENENYNFVVCDMARDFVVGFSFQENLTRTVRHSKRMIFCLTEGWNTSSESFTIAWRIAQEKIKETKSHYGIIVSHGMKKQDLKDRELNRFINRGRFVDSKDKLFQNKVIYYMPQLPISKTNAEEQKVDRNVQMRKKSEYVSRCFINSYCDDAVSKEDTELDDNVFEAGPKIEPKCHAFISYHESDLQYVLQDLVPRLEEKGFTYCIADRDFVPGASIEENILNAIATSHRAIFILSPAHVQNEWSLFTFRTAYEKALRDKSNYLLVVIKEDLENMNIDEEIRHYLQNYICLNVNDRWFEKKLFNGLPLLKDKEELHTSPLFLSNVSSEMIEIDLEDEK